MPDKKYRGISNLPIAIPDVPDAPTVSAADVGTSRAYNNGAATVTFSSPTGGRPSSYSITTTPTTTTTPATSSPVTLTGLTSATSYTATVTPSNVSATGAATTSAAFTATTVPQAPTIGTFTDGGTGTTGTLSFTAGATGGSTITGYKYSTDGTTYTSASGTTSPLSLTGLTAGTYNFSLKATNTNGDSLASGNASGTVITPNSFESIATYTATGGETSFTFSSIPQTYKSLQIRWMYRDAGNGTVAGTCSLAVNMNGTTDDLPYHQLYGNGTSAVANGYSNTSGSYYLVYGAGILANTASANMYGVGIMDILDYSTTTKLKTIRTINGSERNGLANSVGEPGIINLSSSFRTTNTNAITSVKLQSWYNSFVAGTTFALYGIK